MTCPASIRVGGSFFGMTLACRKLAGHKGAHEAAVPEDVAIYGTPGKWVAKVTVRK